jgi:hypothetical protein
MIHLLVLFESVKEAARDENLFGDIFLFIFNLKFEIIKDLFIVGSKRF